MTHQISNTVLPDAESALHWRGEPLRRSMARRA